MPEVNETISINNIKKMITAVKLRINLILNQKSTKHGFKTLLINVVYAIMPSVNYLQGPVTEITMFFRLNLLHTTSPLTIFSKIN